MGAYFFMVKDAGYSLVQSWYLLVQTLIKTPVILSSIYIIKFHIYTSPSSITHNMTSYFVSIVLAKLDDMEYKFIVRSE